MRTTVAKVIGSFVCLILLEAQAVPDAQLNALIQQNIKTSTDSYRSLARPPQAATAELWIHVRSAAQMKLVASNLGWLKNLQWQGHPIDIHPLQLVSDGPQTNQLRFFKSEERAPLVQLQAALAKGIPGLQLQDLSSEYREVGWLQPGHFEIWLAPGTNRFGP